MRNFFVFFLLLACAAVVVGVLPDAAAARDRGTVEDRLTESRTELRQAALARVSELRARVCVRLTDRSVPLLPPFCAETPPEPDPDPDPEPEPTVDHVLISEVLYDLDDAQGSEPANEWVELYNPTNETVDLAQWRIEDNSSDDLIAETALELAPGEYLVITPDSTTADHWDLSSAAVVILNSSIGNGLANDGDGVFLYDAGGAVVDSVSYGSDEAAFAPSVPDVAEGTSIERTALDSDTDTASDWTENEVPTPGS